MGLVMVAMAQIAAAEGEIDLKAITSGTYYADNLKSITFYGSFNRESDSIEDILNALSKANQMKYKYQNGKYILYK